MTKRTCKDCNASYMRGHQCGTAVGSGGYGSSKVLRMMSKPKSVQIVYGSCFTLCLC